MKILNFSVEDFVRESNKIEGILRDPTKEEVRTTTLFLGHRAIRALEIVRLINVYEPGAELRLHPGLNVRVGDHLPPPGGPNIGMALETLIAEAVAGFHTPFEIHKLYEYLHPFTDGNGRSGRALWLWQMLHESRTRLLPLGFLHVWYYQSLDAKR